MSLGCYQQVVDDVAFLSSDAGIELYALLIVAIHQPNFFPWLGYFDKIARADVFCLLDHVQFPKKGGTYINRVQVLVQGAAAYVTVPVERNYSGVLPINQMKIREQEPWREKILRTLQEKWRQHDEMVQKMTDIIKQYGLSQLAMQETLARSIGVERIEAEGQYFRVANNDCARVWAEAASTRVSAIADARFIVVAAGWRP